MARILDISRRSVQHIVKKFRNQEDIHNPIVVEDLDFRAPVNPFFEESADINSQKATIRATWFDKYGH